jgi:hypothetical protein
MERKPWEMFEALQNPVAFAVVGLVLLAAIAIPVLLRRRRAGRDEVQPPDFGQAIDYTSLPFEEPKNLGERIRQAPLGVKLVAGLVPLVLLIGGAILILTFFPSNGGGPTTPEPPPATISNVSARIAGVGKIRVEADTTLPEEAEVQATMLEGDQDFPWYNAEKAGTKVTDGRVVMILERANGAPVPKRDVDQSVVLSATGPNGQPVQSEPAKVEVVARYEGDYFQIAAAVEPTAVPATPTPEPTTPEPSPEVTTEPEPTATAAVTLTATVFNGGNIRRVPEVTQNQEDVLGQIHAGEVVTLLEQSANGQWYRVQAQEAEGWVSKTLLTIDAAVAEQVPKAALPSTGLTATVFNGGNVRERPVTGRPLDQINAGETVQLVSKTADGGWYLIINERNVQGWVSVTLLNRIPEDVAQQVPVAQ